MTYSDINLEGLRSPAPKLRELRLSSFGGQIRLPIPLFQDHTPQLCVVILHGVDIPLSSPIFSGLQWLDLDSVESEDGVLSQLVHNIASCPLLQYFRLTYHSPFLPEAQRPPIPPVHLPHLRCMLIHLKESDIIYLLSSSFPVQLKLGMVLNLSEYHLSLTSTDTSIVERLPILARIRSVRVTIDDDVCRFAVTGRDGLWHETDIDLFEILYSTFNSVQLVEMLLPVFGEQSPFPALEELYFEGFCYAVENEDPLLFIRALLNFPTITSLTLFACPPSFLEALIVDPDSPLHTCPLLERLVISDSHPDLIRIIKSRLENPRHVTPLRHLTIVGSDSIDEITILALQALPIRLEVKDDIHYHWRPGWPTRRLGLTWEYSLGLIRQLQRD